MTHNDKIKDMDAFFEVNPITRQIVNKTPAKIVLMQGDHNSERFTFSLPRYIEGHDMAESAKANLHYKNVTKPEVFGMYEMKDLKVDPDNPDNVICSWLISGNATKEAGVLSFMIEFECLEGDVLVYSWHTLPHTGISVGQGFDNAEEIAEMYADVLQQWHNEIAIGKNTEYGGIILGNTESNKAYSANSVAGGYLTQAGSRGYKILSCANLPGNIEHSFELSSTEGLAIGQTVSIRTTSHYVSCGTIEAYEGNNVSVKTTKAIQFKLETDPDDPEHFVMENYLTVDGHPELGDTVVAFNGFSFGEDCIAQERDTFSTGRANKSLGQYGFTANRGNTAGYAAAGFGYLNKVLANYTFGAGSQNNLMAPYAAAFNQSNTIESTSGFSCGIGGKIGVNSPYCFTANKGNSVENSEGVFVCGESNSVENGENDFVANEGNKVFNGKHNAIFGNKNTAGTGSSFSFITGQRHMSLGVRLAMFGYGHVGESCKDSVLMGAGNICHSDWALRRGKYCLEDTPGMYADIVGNGYSNNEGTKIVRSNAYTLDWKGNAWYAGTVETTGVILTSPNGTRFKLTVADDGTLTTVKA